MAAGSGGGRLTGARKQGPPGFSGAGKGVSEVAVPVPLFLAPSYLCKGRPG